MGWVILLVVAIGVVAALEKSKSGQCLLQGMTWLFWLALLAIGMIAVCAGGW